MGWWRAMWRCWWIARRVGRSSSPPRAIRCTPPSASASSSITGAHLAPSTRRRTPGCARIRRRRGREAKPDMLYRRALRPLLFTVAGRDPEAIHERVLAGLAAISRYPALTRALAIASSLGHGDDAALAREVFGL